MTEKALLQAEAVIGVEMREVRVAVHLQPLLSGSGLQVAFEIAARMQPDPAPMGGREQRNIDYLERRHSRAIVVVDEPARRRLLADLGAVLLQLRFRQGI